jgi:transcriptional regulator with PAS, ATPase and Fis domain
VFHIVLPPLRERKEDIPAISDAIVTNLNQKHGCHVAGLHPEVLEAFQKASWPGNVRQLRNVLERAVIVAGEGSILPKHLSRDWSGGSSPLPVAADEESDDSIRIRVGPEMRQIEEAYINLVLKRTNNNKTRAAHILGISIRTLQNRLGSVSRGTAKTASISGRS